MAVLDTHGRKMIGIKKASGEMEDFGYYSGLYNELFYDRDTGEVWTVSQCSLGQNAYTIYDKPSVVKICNTSRHMTMQEIADSINERMWELECLEQPGGSIRRSSRDLHDER